MNENEKKFRRYLSSILPLGLYVNLSNEYIEGLIRFFLRNEGRQKSLFDEELDAASKREAIQMAIQEFLEEVRLNGPDSDRAYFLLQTIELIFYSNQTPRDKSQE